MAQTLAWVFGIVLTAVGILGFVPGVTTDGLLLGIFATDTVHNVIHLATGILGLIVAMTAGYTMWYFRIFGIVYALVAVVGFVQGDNVLGLISTNMADHVLHLAIAVVALWAGFGMRGTSVAPAMGSSSGMGGQM